MISVMNALLHCLVICLLLLTASSWCCPQSQSCNKLSLTSLLDEGIFIIQAIQCHKWCLKQNEITLPSISLYNQWPSLNISALTEDCYKYQKIEQCRLGCLTTLKQPTLTVNKCRNKCYETCTRSCNGQKDCTLPDRPCPRKCRKTFCRKGCNYSLKNTRSNNVPSSLQPLSPPSLVQSDSEDYAYTVSFPNSTATTNASNMSSDWVDFLFKVQDLQDNITRYYWQTDLTLTLKLTAFACRNVYVSMAVVSATGITNYSPATQVCVQKDIQFPLQVRADQIRLNYEEDSHRLGFVTIAVSWDKPQGHEAVSSYSVYLLSRDIECGGVDELYPYEGITENAVIISPIESAQFPRFGCTYELLVKVHPSASNSGGTQIQVTPQLPDLTEEIELTCTSVEASNGSLLLIANWSLPNVTLVTETVHEFVLSVKSHSNTTIKANASQRWYNSSAVISNVSANFTEVTLRPIRNPQYYWRPLPKPQKCRVSNNLFPSLYIPLNIQLKLQSSDNITNINVSWSLTEWPTHVELLIGRSVNQAVYRAIVEAKLQSSVIQIAISNNYYLWARALQNNTVSSWGDPFPIQQQQQQVSKSHKEEIDIIQQKLKALEERIKVLSNEHQSMAHLNTRLDRLEKQLNNISNHIISL